ncbi:MAG: phosphate ABC transporter permease subunit PstC, partial [Gammaproteobacteria bacterium]
MPTGTATSSATRHLGERLIESVLFLASFSAVAVTVAIVAILVYESLEFFQQVPISDFLTDTQWTIMFADKHYGVLPLLAGTLVTTTVAL